MGGFLIFEKRGRAGEDDATFAAMKRKDRYDASGVYDMSISPYLLLQRIVLKETILQPTIEMDHFRPPVSGNRLAARMPSWPVRPATRH